jgi:hypothetical protein
MDSMSKHIAELVNEWVGLDTEFDGEMVFNFLWAASMDQDLQNLIDRKIASLKVEHEMAHEI